MKICALKDGTFVAEVPLKDHGMFTWHFSEAGLLKNFQLETVPKESIFEAEPRSLADYSSRA